MVSKISVARWIGGVAACGVVAGLAACGGSSSPSAPTPPSGATITIAASGISPRSVQIRVGSRVTFANSGALSHTISSDPHPVHTDCTEVNQVGVIAPGQSKDTGPFATARTCGFHDHERPDDDTLKGSIVVVP